jgi:uncharacterized protein
MTSRTHAPAGSPCWADLWTSDVPGIRTFYSRLFGWEALEPDPQYGGYFLFTRDEAPVAGCMGDMPDMPAQDVWKIFLDTPDLDRVLREAGPAGAEVVAPAMPVGDLGTQAVLTDPTGAMLGVWQPGSFPGFTTLGEAGSPSWFELHTRDHDKAVTFYRSVFGWETEPVGDTDAFRYTVMRSPEGEGELAGIMDASSFLPEGVPAHWSVYWHVDDVDAAVSTVEQLGGSVVMAPEDTPYGRLASVADPRGALFKLRTPPKG